MRYATGGRSLDRRGFEQWCGQGDGMSRYLEESGLRWIDSIEVTLGSDTFEQASVDLLDVRAIPQKLD